MPLTSVSHASLKTKTKHSNCTVTMVTDLTTEGTASGTMNTTPTMKKATALTSVRAAVKHLQTKTTKP